MKISINNPQFWRSRGIDEKEIDEFEIEIDQDGNFKLPKPVQDKLKFKKNTKIKLELGNDTLLIKRADPTLSKIYIEPTADCNLNCKTCLRNAWEEEIGHMELDTYKQLINDLKEFDDLKRISFWGIGEPLYHPEIVKMVEMASQLSVKTQIITNGLLLDQKISKKLLNAGLDSLVVSIDGTSPETMEEVRSGANLEEIISNVKAFNELKDKKLKAEAEIGIEFVIMKSNINELKDLRKLAIELGASFIFLTNLLPYTEAMTDEILYSNSISRSKPSERNFIRPEIYLPPTDLQANTLKDIIKVMGKTSSISTKQVPFDPHGGYCKFVEEGSIAVNWQGEVSPCIPLMHSYDCYIRERKKHIQAYSLGNVAKTNIKEIWNLEEFKDFRKKLIEFPFSECTQCSGCERSETNLKDCHGNEFPVCGDCLWAKGVIQCP